ncbi:hypothetical protein MLD38_036796 [Melastoma candidum]|uniref:Uncharacterized protein n=1 Tax=Melastoma candidum TaxID=119954 RepID=A0ACB9LL63_9MYRT|nr:hypothetical protein MLD38_036796 [Melastoma candidum]
MEENLGELHNLLKVWLSVAISLTYCYTVARFIPKGLPRLLSVLPIVALFFFLPLKLTSVHLGGSSSFFIAWLANFKLLLFAFGKGPLCSDPDISLLRFLTVACLPIKIQQPHNPRPAPKAPHQNGDAGKVHGPSKPPRKGHKSIFNYAAKMVLFAAMLKCYDYREVLPEKVIWFLYGFHIYFLLEIILATVAYVARVLLGLELEPQFNEPYLSTSLQDFWGRRWNIMVTSILRPTVYEPILGLSTRIVGRRLAPLPAVMGTFVVSALMHELIFYYLGRTPPTWEVTWFFLFHGLCLMVEIALKKQLRVTTGPPRAVASLLTVGFVMVTAFWWFLPPMLRFRADERAFEEYAAIAAYAKGVGGKIFNA